MLWVGFVLAQKTDPKSDALIGSFRSRAEDSWIELSFGKVVDMGIPQQINGWILQRTSDLDAGYHALNSSGFLPRFNRATVYRRLPEIPPSELDEIFAGLL